MSASPHHTLNSNHMHSSTMDNKVSGILRFLRESESLAGRVAAAGGLAGTSWMLPYSSDSAARTATA